MLPEFAHTFNEYRLYRLFGLKALEDFIEKKPISAANRLTSLGDRDRIIYTQKELERTQFGGVGRKVMSGDGIHEP